jgi:chorismate mutase/prephenate dehydratase
MDLNELHQEIDGIDDGILELFQKRMRISEDIARYKLENSLPIADPARERDIIHRMCSACGEDAHGSTRLFYRTLFDISRSRQTALMRPASTVADEVAKTAQAPAFPQTCVVACQGIEGAYSQIAADRLFSSSKIMYMRTFDSVFNAVEKGLCSYGVLPVDNSTAGSVTEVFDLMKKYRFRIVRSIKLRISHVLMAKPGVELKNVKEIFSHAHALNQCSEFLKAHPDIKVTVCENTAIAAMAAANSDRDDIAAISSKNCTGLYGLYTLSETVQNSDHNYTRFICISRDLELYPGANKISLMFTLENKVGTLYSVISRLTAAGINLTKLESRPVPGTDFEFMFYFDIDGSVRDEHVMGILSELERNSGAFMFLGNYSEV